MDNLELYGRVKEWFARGWAQSRKGWPMGGVWMMDAKGCARAVLQKM